MNHTEITALTWTPVTEGNIYESYEATDPAGFHYFAINVERPSETPWAAITSSPQRATMKPTLAAAQEVCGLSPARRNRRPPVITRGRCCLGGWLFATHVLRAVDRDSCSKEEIEGQRCQGSSRRYWV